MPWIIASQTIPILAIAPMVIVVLGSVGLYRAGAQIDHLDVSVFLSRCHRHGEGAYTRRTRCSLISCAPTTPVVSQVLWKLRFPAAMPFLFAVAEGGRCHCADRRHCRRAANRGAVRHRFAHAGGFLLRTDHSDLVGAGCRIRRGRSTGLRRWAGLSASSTGRWERGHEGVFAFRDILAPALFGIAVLVLWQATVRFFNVPFVIFPAPTDIWSKLIVSLPMLYADFVQTFIRAVIPGWIIGSLAGFLVAIAIDRSPSCRRACCRSAISSRRSRSSALRRSWSCGSASTGSRRWRSSSS